MAAHDWDGATYDRISAPLERNGMAVLDRLPLEGHETVLDAGCGSGRVTEKLAGRLPRGRVIGVDGSAGMIDAARQRLGESVELILCDLTELDLGGRRVDAVFSNAVFHWISDHDLLFARLHSVLADGGRLVAQCGGEGNMAELLSATVKVGSADPFAPYLEGFSAWNYVGRQETAARLRAAGFTDIETALVPRPAPYEDDLREWLRVNALSAHLPRLPEDLRERYVDAVHAELGPDPELSYIRLEIDAVAAA
ncbi:MAG: methyltransferase domain-containing protein [Solirubrobacteraceae bacterium]